MNFAELYLESNVIYNYSYQKLSSARFTFRKHKVGNEYLDNGKCEVCNTRGERVLVESNIPIMCYKCYVLMRKYREKLTDPLNLHKKKYLSLNDCKNIRNYMRNNSELLVGMGFLAALALIFEDEDGENKEYEESEEEKLKREEKERKHWEEVKRKEKEDWDKLVVGCKGFFNSIKKFLSDKNKS